MGWGIDDLTAAVSDIGGSARRLGSQIDDWMKPTALSYLASPLIAQDIAGAAFGGALSRGADIRTAFQKSAVSPASLIGGGSSQEWKDLAAFNAAIAAGAATGGLSSSLVYTSPAALSPIGTVAGSVTGALAAGGAAYAGGQALANVNTTESYDTPSPPDVQDMYKNDPQQAQQFQRLRKAARMLGRAGTIKYKGSSQSLGMGEGALGDSLSLIGS